MAHIDTFKGWAETIRQDIEAFKALLEAKQASGPAKKLAGTALLYLVSRMDLIPDWNEGIGVIDDVMVLRVCAHLAQDHEKGQLSTTHDATLERLANQSEKIQAFLGSSIYDRFKAYCTKLGDQAVRGRTPTELVEDETSRKALYVEVEDELKKSVPIVINDPSDAELRLKAYLTHKLQG